MVERGWQGAAAVAAYDCQSRSLNLPPWEAPPCVASVRGNSRAARLLRRMLKRGISRWHPRPLEAIAAAGPVKKKSPREREGKIETLEAAKLRAPQR